MLLTRRDDPKAPLHFSCSCYTIRKYLTNKGPMPGETTISLTFPKCESKIWRCEFYFITFNLTEVPSPTGLYPRSRASNWWVSNLRVPFSFELLFLFTLPLLPLMSLKHPDTHSPGVKICSAPPIDTFAIMFPLLLFSFILGYLL